MSIADANTDMTRAGARPGRYPVNLRVTIPFLPKPLFVTLIIGQERRGRHRLREERQKHPVNTWGNLATVVTSWTIFSIAALFAALVVSAL